MSALNKLKKEFPFTKLILKHFKSNNMEKRKVIKSKYLPSRIPTIPTLSIVMALDYWNAPQWL